MTGWIIQGVRGEGKSLAAVYKARDYLRRGCVVATNLDLFVDELVDQKNTTLSYRLPDKPRIDDFELLGSAYDPKYKGEDKNGLLVLDELGTWLNSRSWKDKERDKILNWLFLSRKLHWDVILLAQDHEMIDKQAKTTLCDYLVQASRTDRQKIPLLAPFLDFFGFHSFKPLVHLYDVYYGFHQQSNPVVEQWEFKGKDVYDGYDTNQFFTDGMEVFEINGKAVISDQRATFTNLPASYLSGYHFLKPHLERVKLLKKHFTYQEKTKMALRSSASTGFSKPKLIILLLVTVGYLFYQFKDGIKLPSLASSSDSSLTTSELSLPPQSIPSALPVSLPSASTLQPLASSHRHDFLALLIQEYKPRLSAITYHPKLGAFGSISFYDAHVLVERFSFHQLKSLGASIIPKSYGVDLVTNGGIIVVTRWKMRAFSKTEHPVSSLSNHVDIF